MKNIKLLLSALFIATFSCNNDGDVIKSTNDEGSIIRFGGNIIITKAIIDNTTFPDNSQVGILGWGYNKNNPEGNMTIRKDLNNSPYTKATGSNEFASDVHAHYSINPDTLLNFYAYYPYTEAATATPLSIPFDLTKQNDIMWATPVLNKDKTTANPVNLSFNHILSAITLKFKKADDIKEDMIIQSISMENYPSTIQLNVQTGKLNATASATPYTLIDNISKEITQNEETIVTNYLLYPIEKPVFIVQMSGKNYRIESTKAFEGGKKQTYSFTIQAQNITISGSINPWQDGGTSNETVYF